MLIVFNVRSFLHMNQALYAFITTPTQSTFFCLCLQAFRQTEPSRWVDCLALTVSKRSVFPRAQRRTASSGIEPGFSKLSITNLLLQGCYSNFARIRSVTGS